MCKKRKQLTLFINESESKAIETTREIFNPKQYAIIKSHVTLGREDELEPLEKIIQNLKKLNLKYLTIDLGDVARFSNGKGVIITAIGKNEQYYKLRKLILDSTVEIPKKPEPHITLMHPANSTCTDEIFEQIKKCTYPKKVLFSKISLIEQEIGMKWTILEEFELSTKMEHK